MSDKEVKTKKKNWLKAVWDLFVKLVKISAILFLLLITIAVVVDNMDGISYSLTQLTDKWDSVSFESISFDSIAEGASKITAAVVEFFSIVVMLIIFVVVFFILAVIARPVNSILNSVGALDAPSRSIVSIPTPTVDLEISSSSRSTSTPAPQPSKPAPAPAAPAPRHYFATKRESTAGGSSFKIDVREGRKGIVRSFLHGGKLLSGPDMSGPWVNYTYKIGVTKKAVSYNVETNQSHSYHS